MIQIYDSIALFSDWSAKVTDFGLSKLKEATSSRGIQTNGVGTANWMAPEMIDKDLPKTEKIDVYRFVVKILIYLNFLFFNFFKSVLE